MKIFENEFGAYDTRFLGICQRFTAPELWEKYLELISLAPDSKRIDWGHTIMDLPPEESFELLCLASWNSHEIRHFHDYLLSPFGSHVFRMRCDAAIIAQQIITRAINKTKLIAVPIPLWTSLPLQEKFKYVEQWRAYSQICLNSDSFYMPSGDENQAVSRIVKNLSKIQSVYSDIAPGAFGLLPSHIFEGSAVLVQAQDLWSNFGEEQFNLFLNFITTSEELQNYGKTFQIASQLISKVCDPRDATNLIRRMLTWSLLGSYRLDRDKANPATRFSMLYSGIASGRIPYSDTIDTLDIFSEWDQLSRCTITESLNDINQENIKTMHKFSEPPFTSPPFDRIATVFSAYTQANCDITQRFLKNPDRYILPHLYIDDSTELPAAWNKIDFLVGGMFCPGPKEIEKYCEIRRGKNIPGGLLVEELFLKDQPIGNIYWSREQAVDLYEFLTITDYTFAEFNRADPTLQSAADILKKGGATLFEVIY